MARIAKPAPMSGYDIKAVAPQGQYAAICLSIDDLFGVERRKFQSEEKEIKDVTRFLFGCVDPGGTPYLVQTYEFAISGAPGANLMKFLTNWLGQSPQYEWDYCEMLGIGALLSVAPKTSKGEPPIIYPTITGIAPLPQVMIPNMPSAATFAPLIAAAKRAEGGDTPSGASVAPSLPSTSPQGSPALPAPPAPPVQKEGESFPPGGWLPHPQAPGHFYKGQEVLSEADLRGKSPAPLAIPAAPPIETEAAAGSPSDEGAEIEPF